MQACYYPSCAALACQLFHLLRTVSASHTTLCKLHANQARIAHCRSIKCRSSQTLAFTCPFLSSLQRTSGLHSVLHRPGPPHLTLHCRHPPLTTHIPLSLAKMSSLAEATQSAAVTAGVKRKVEEATEVVRETFVQDMAALRVKRNREHARLPERQSPGAAGYDLYSSDDGVVPARGTALIPTGLIIAIPDGTYARVAPRSGLSLKHSIGVGAGVVDQDYRGEVGVVLHNHSDKDFLVKRGDRIAQLVLEKIMTPPVVEVEDLDATERGAGGFGSTGGVYIAVTNGQTNGAAH